MLLFFNKLHQSNTTLIKHQLVGGTIVLNNGDDEKINMFLEINNFELYLQKKKTRWKKTSFRVDKPMHFELEMGQAFSKLEFKEKFISNDWTSCTALVRSYIKYMIFLFHLYIWLEQVLTNLPI
jgi:hypothetical protein